MIRVEAAARLHFGLLSVPIPSRVDSRARQYGGVGLMIDSPRVVVHACVAENWSAEGPDALRALGYAQRFASTLPADRRLCYALVVEQCPEAHVGLGSGTALALAVAQAAAMLSGFGDWPAVELARRVGRGQRSAIGVHGFARGGLIVEPGKTAHEEIAPLIASYNFPADWRVVLVRPACHAPWHGPRERAAFESLTLQNPTDSLWRLVTGSLLPALAAADLDAFGESLHEYNVRAGEAFAQQQGGAYADPAVAELVTCLRARGIRGVGQSSWGPTVFALVGDENEANDVVEFLQSRSIIDKNQVRITQAVPCK